MNILISQILLFMNGCYDHQEPFYLIAKTIVENYLSIEDYTMQQLIEESNTTKTQLKNFYEFFGFSSWNQMKQQFIDSRLTRKQQQKLRFIHLDKTFYYKHLEYIIDRSSFDIFTLKQQIDQIVETIHQSQQLYLFGAVYPLSLSVEFQTSMVSVGKPVYQWHSSQKYQAVRLNENDFAFIFSASGRYITQCKQIFGDVYYSLAKKALLIQNQQYNHLNKLDYFISFPETEDVYMYNHLLVIILELIYIEYYCKYILE